MCVIWVRYLFVISTLALWIECEPRDTDKLLDEMKSELASRGACWVDAVEDLDPDHRSKEWLAFNFMNCFFRGANFTTYFCPRSKPLATCDEFRKLLVGIHRNVYLVFHHQAELLIEYLRERDRQKNIGQQIMLREAGLAELRERLSESSDLLLESLNNDKDISDLKRLVAKSHVDYKQSLRVTQRILFEIKTTVTQYKILGFTIAGLALFAVNQALHGVFN